MAIVYSTTVKNNRLQKVIDNADAGPSFATLVIGTSALSGVTGVLATITLLKPSFGAPSAGAMSLAGVPLTVNASAGGTAAKAELRDSTGTVIASGLTVGTSGTDIVVNTTAISSGQAVQVTSATITHG